MKKPPQELINAFWEWYEQPYSNNEDCYNTYINKKYLSGLSKSEFIDFFEKFAKDGGRVQSGGQRTSPRFRKTIEENYAQFRDFALAPFEPDFDDVQWVAESEQFKYFGAGLATVYLNRVDKKRFPILNNKVADSLALFDVALPADRVKRYQIVRETQQQLIDWFPTIENFFRADALNQFLIGEEVGQPWKELLASGSGPTSNRGYWLFQSNPKIYDVIGALRDGALKIWTVNQHKKEIKTGDRVILWVSGKDRGCYGLATVMSEVKIHEEDDKEASYWIKAPEKGPSEGVVIRIDKNLWDAPVLKAELDGLSEFSDFPAGITGTNFKISEAHFKGIQDIISRRDQMRYWLYAPGPNAKFWEECLEKGIMVYGADELVDLQTYENKDAIEEALKKALGKKERPTNDALAAWEFSRILKPGDIIIAKQGRQKYIGYGIVTGPYTYDESRKTYRNIRTVKWVKKGEWIEDKGPIVLKTLTDITKYPEYVVKLKDLIGIEEAETTPEMPMAALNIILYGPPGTGKTFALCKEYAERFTEIQMVTQEQFAREIVGELTWFQTITIVLYDLQSAKVPDIFGHPLMQAKISILANQNPKNAIWAVLQRHTKMDCPNVSLTKRDEPLIFFKNEHSVWTVDKDMVNEQLSELVSAVEAFQQFEPVAKKIKRFEYVTFHQSYCYEDFVEGIKPVMSEDVTESLTYEIKPGIFRKMVKRAMDDPAHSYALLIDEINRGNVASIFGELISLIEDDKREGEPNMLTAQLPYSREEFVVPHNLYIIGAMNTADRSIEALDTALRRRFTFVSIPPKPDCIKQPAGLGVDLQRLLITINRRIEKLLDKDHCIGHSYFMGIVNSQNPFSELRGIFAKKILPLLEEYFYSDPAKIGMILGERFVERIDEEIKWAWGDWGIDDFEERRVYTTKDPMGLNEEDFRTVYE